MSETKYCGKAIIRNTKFGEIFAITLSPNDIKIINENKKDNGWCNLEMLEMKQPDKNGNTFTIRINEWKPNGSNGTPPPRSSSQQQSNTHRYSSADKPTEHSIAKGNAYQPQRDVDNNQNEEDDIPF